MKEFVEKLIGRLEEIYNRNNKQKKEAYEEQEWERFDFFTHRNEGIYIAMAIVNKLAEEYKDKLDDEWQIIYNKILNLEKKYANDGNTESVNDCIKLENLLQYFKEELRSEEEYINTSTDTSSGWIPCSERLPEEKGEYLVTLKTGVVTSAIYDLNENKWVDAMEEYFEYPCIAWQPLPQPYKPQKLEWKDKVMKHFTNVE